MSTFDSTKKSLGDLLKEITLGKIQLPDFQRGWVWDDDHIKDLLVSIARSFPVGAIMLLESGGDIKFQTRPLEGVNLSDDTINPEKLILDGQQRLTTLTQALAIKNPVNTSTSKGNKIKRYYYFNIEKALESPRELENAIIAVDENKQIRTNFGRDIELDLSTVENECKELYFPCNQIMNSDEWEQVCSKISSENFLNKYMKFREVIINAFRHYQIPVIQLHKETPKEAVCLVFEKVNTGGVKLDVFELITASYAAEGYNLRDDWYGAKDGSIESRKKRIAENPLLINVEATDFLQAITILYTYERKNNDIKSGKVGKQVRPVSAKRIDILELPLQAWKDLSWKVEKGFNLVSKFLKKEAFFSSKDIPYSTQIIPLAAILSYLDERWLEPIIYKKLSRWFWCGVLGELYGGAVETRMANDYEQLINWIENEDQIPRTIQDANFQIDRFFTLKSRLSAAYKGINVLMIREGAKDWFWKASIQELDKNEVLLDIHHIFPKSWCEKNNIPKQKFDCILNKTPLSYKANRKIGGVAPSLYLKKIEAEKNVELTSAEMDKIIETHFLNPEYLRKDDFENFFEDRKNLLSKIIEKAMDKNVSI
ncbi:MAG: DUF262 domain-containing protein [Spirochaetota bacterium]